MPRYLVPIFLLSSLLLPLSAAGSASGPWRRTVIDQGFRAEDIAVADVNRDGKPDLLAGELWYEAPYWKPHEIRKPGVYSPAGGYSEAFITDAADVDGDGWADQIVVGFPGKPAVWRKNPAGKPGHWQEFPITDSACNESPLWIDLTGDGKPELLTAYQEKRMAYYTPGDEPEKGWRQHLIGPEGAPGVQRFAHGLGVGDVNGDGKRDILTRHGWYQAPAVGEEWSFVPADLGADCAQMWTFDFDGDGDQDVISSSAHRIGVWWHEQVKGAGGKPAFRQHLIDDSFSQSHALFPHDINGDGRVDWVTGKRWWAHGPAGDVNPNDPPVLLWFEWSRKDGRVIWTRRQIDDASGVGTGFKVIDINGNGMLDIAIANKSGVFLFEQQKGK